MKRLAIAGFAVLFAVGLNPQILDAGVGIKAGYSLSKFALTTTPAPTFEFDNLPYFAGGIYFDLRLGFVSIQPEVLYTRLGATIEVEGSEDGLEFWLDYVQAPVVLKLNIIPAGPVRPFIYGGGYGAYLIKATGVTVVGGERTKNDIIDSYQKLDYGVVGGAGLTFKLPGISISIEGRYNYGLMNIMMDPPEGDSMKNRSMMALLSIGF